VLGVDGRGVGAFAVHPTEPLVVVGEKGNDPNIYCFSYPSWELTKVLKKGCERGYSCLSFSPNGEKLASVAMAPDFNLTIWDWRSERIELHTKAFGQDVYKVAWSPTDPMKLTTSGTGHIRFWRMARTFTGLKLQGDIGKFGKVELSDVDDFAEMPDGKVLSGTESGALLVWEGPFIKYRLVRPGGRRCHAGAITSVHLIKDPATGKGVAFATGGTDGKICWWDFKAVDEAEIDMDKSTDFELSPVVEVPVGPPGQPRVAVRTVLRGGVAGGEGLSAPHAMVVDLAGKLWRLELSETFTAHPKTGLYELDVEVPEEGAVQVLDFHSKGVSAMDVSPVDHFAVTGGEDGAWTDPPGVRRRARVKNKKKH